MKILKPTTELGVSGKLTILWEQSISKMDWLCLPMKTFAGFRLATLSLQYGEILQPYLISTTRKYTFINQKVLEIEESETIILYKLLFVLNYSTVFTTNNKAENQTKYPVLQQHLYGLSKEQAVFNMECHVYGFFGRTKGNTVLCTCCLPQNGGITEYTLFSHQHLKKKSMKTKLQYIENWHYEL
jgi:hypothetical protein